MRTFFRYIFSVGVFVTGADGLRSRPLIGLNPVALDILTTALTFAFNLVLMISVMVALPRQYGPAGSKVMVGYVHKEDDGAKTAGRRSSNPFRRLGATGQGGPDVPAGTASQFALMTLLREGGQWEGEADVLRDVHDTTSPSRAAHDIEDRNRTDERDLRFDGDRVATNDSRAGLIQNTKAWEGDEPQTQLPPAVS